MRAVVFSGLAAILACSAPVAASSNGAPDGKPPKPDTPLGSTIRYTLPRMTVDIAVTLTLKSCETKPEIVPAVKLTPVIGLEARDIYRFELDAAYLQSFSRDKSLGIETYPNGTLKSINGGAIDQTAGIVTSIIKTIASVATLAAARGNETLASDCSQQVRDQLALIVAYRDGMKELRKDLLSKDPEKVVRAKAAIDALAAEIARIETKDLTLTLKPVSYVLDKGWVGDHIYVTRANLKKWLDDRKGEQAGKIPALTLAFCALTKEEADKQGDRPECTGTLVDAGLATLRDNYTGTEPKPKGLFPLETPNCDAERCQRTVVLREPKPAVLLVAAEGDGYTRQQGEILDRADVLISQWGSLSYVPVKAGFGKSVTFQLGFDASGHKFSQSWSYKARGAGIFGGVSGAADAAAALDTKLSGLDLAKDKVELDRLTTQKNLNQMRFCAAVIDAGGFTCPTQ